MTDLVDHIVQSLGVHWARGKGRKVDGHFFLSLEIVSFCFKSCFKKVEKMNSVGKLWERSGYIYEVAYSRQLAGP